jgi:cytochrome c oxidase assembly protein subunit 11
MSKRNKQTLITVSSIAIGMFALAFAFVPLYNIFCKVTGYGGATQTSIIAPEVIGKRNLKIFFNSDIANDLNWSFKTSQRYITLFPGEEKLAFFEAVNLSEQDLWGTATYNVTPEVAGKYFNKIECFCFTEQMIKGRGKASFPVSFFIDPEIENDPYLKNLKEITLSYSFFKLDK